MSDWVAFVSYILQNAYKYISIHIDYRVCGMCKDIRYNKCNPSSGSSTLD